MNTLLRDATPADFPALLALNAAAERFTSPLDPARLAALHAQAARHRVAEHHGSVVAFLLADEAGWLTGQTVVVDGGLMLAGGLT